MKIVHLVLDGYHPDNLMREIDPRNVISKVAGRVVEPYVFRSIDKSRPLLISPQMWSRVYSKIEMDQIQRENPVENNGYYRGTQYADVPVDQWIWNAVDCPSFVFLNYKFDPVVDSIFSNNVSGVVKTFKTKRKFVVSKGIPSKRTSSRKYWSLCEVTDDLKYNSDINPKLTELWKSMKKGEIDNESKDQKVNEIVELVGIATREVYKEHISDNLEGWSLDVVPELEKFADSITDKCYLTVQLTESDNLYHTCLPYKEVLCDFNIYLETIIRDIVKFINPDAIMVSGDHGMRSSGESGGLVVNYTDSEGVTHVAEKSAYNNNIYFTEHTNEIGALVYDLKGKLDLSKFAEKDELYCDTMYDAIVGSLK